MMPDRQTQKKDVVDNDDQYYEILPSSSILSRLQKLVATGHLPHICHINDDAGMVWSASCW